MLLVEAGESGESDPLVTEPGRWVSLLGSRYDWGDETEPEPGLDGRRLAFPRGRAYGGSSAVNAMVHIRGHRACFDGWQALGNPGWGYDDLLPLFRRSESSDNGPTPYRGADGPLAVRRCLDPHASHEAFLRAAVERGFRADARHDFNAPDPDGVAGFVEKNIRNGRRHSAAAAFLIPVLTRPNVSALAAAQVTRLLVEGRRAVGVECVRGGRVERYRAAREVVLCAGAVDSPRLLMLSGIGDAGALRAHGLGVVADVPGVGRHLQDHLKLSIRWRAARPLPGSTVTAGLFTSSRGSSIADLQFYVGRGLDQRDELMTLTVSLVRPESHGSIALRSVDPLARPAIVANYLQAQRDVDALIHGVRLARDIGGSPAYDAIRRDETEPGSSATTDAQLERFVRLKSDTIYHAAGTCRMGPSPQDGAVVDGQLRVYGVDGLRVADASIMPEVVNAPTHAGCVMIGEKCADLLRG